MRISLPTLLSGLIPSALSLATTLTTTVTLAIPPSQHLPNPNILPPSTHATLTTLHGAFTAPLSVTNAFVFHNVTPGSYLADVHCASFAFAPLRVDVDVVGASDGHAEGSGLLSVKAWETFRGNDWGNKGEEVAQGVGGVGGREFVVKCLGKRLFFQERGTFSPLSLLKNPMILMGLVSMAIFVGMPKLVANMDPEMRAEWEENQKKNPVQNLLNGGQGGGSNPMGNFDMAAFMAGSGKKDEGNAEGGGSTGAGSGGNGGKKGGKR